MAQSNSIIIIVLSFEIHLALGLYVWIKVTFVVDGVISLIPLVIEHAINLFYLVVTLQGSLAFGDCVTHISTYPARGLLCNNLHLLYLRDLILHGLDFGL